MNATYSLLRSRTFWILVIAGLLPAANLAAHTLPMGIQDGVEAVLAILAVWTHNDTAQKAGAVN